MKRIVALLLLLALLPLGGCLGACPWINTATCWIWAWSEGT